MGMWCFLVQKCSRVITVSCFSIHFCSQPSQMSCLVRIFPGKGRGPGFSLCCRPLALDRTLSLYPRRIFLYAIEFGINHRRHATIPRRVAQDSRRSAMDHGAPTHKNKPVHCAASGPAYYPSFFEINISE